MCESHASTAGLLSGYSVLAKKRQSAAKIHTSDEAQTPVVMSAIREMPQSLSTTLKSGTNRWSHQHNHTA